MTEKYAGYSNIHTFNLKMYIENDKELNKLILTEIKKIYLKNEKKALGISELSDYLEIITLNLSKELFNNPRYNLLEGFFDDTLNLIIRKIDYYELANEFYLDYIENYSVELKTA